MFSVVTHHCCVFPCTQLECVVRLVQMGCEVNTVTSRFSQTPTHTAAFGGHPHCVVWLTQAGADVNRQVSPAIASSIGGIWCNIGCSHSLQAAFLLL